MVGPAAPSPGTGQAGGQTKGAGTGTGGGGRTSVDTVDLNTARADRPLWLVKIPKFVAQTWLGHTEAPPPAQKGGRLAAGPSAAAAAAASASSAGAQSGAVAAQVKEGEVVGKVRMEFDPLTETNEFTVFLNPPSSEPGPGARGVAKAIPGAGSFHFPLTYMQNNIPMHVFSDNPVPPGVLKPPPSSSTPGLLLEGKVEYKFDMTIPQGGDQALVYNALVRERTKVASTPQMRTMPDEEAGLAARPSLSSQLLKRKAAGPGAGGLKALGAQGQAQGPSWEAKKVRMDKDALETMLFRLFEKQTTWTLKQLLEATLQPQHFLKEVLNGVCTYHKKGPLLGQYELKPEYKQQQEEPKEKGDGEGGAAEADGLADGGGDDVF